MAKTEDVVIKTRATATVPAKRDVFQYTFAESLDEAREWYGEKLCNDLIKKAIKVGAQAAGRPMLAASKDHSEIQAAVSAFKPEEGSRRGRVKYITDMDTLKEQFATMPQNEKAAMLAMFEAYLRGEDAPSVTLGTETENGDDEDENGDDEDDEDGEQPASTESPPGNVNRAQPRRRGPNYS